MAEYIDREKIFPNGVFYVSAENPESSLTELINRICNLPTADVVPKSEVENYKQIAETQQKLSMDRYFEIKELKEDNERLKDDNEYLQDKVFKVRLEVAREIFEEIEDCMKDFEDDDDGYLLKKCEFEFFMRELKKKYTEEKE